jgi:DNA-directed RNA polymerase specialized sigma24 family protein
MARAVDNTDDPESLPQRILNKEEQAFIDFSNRYGARFYRYFRSRGLPDADASDLVASCMTDIPLKVARYERRSNACFDAWVYKLIENAAHDWWRERHGRLDSLWTDLRPVTDSGVSQLPAEETEAIQVAVDTLDILDQEILDLRYSGASRPDFAEIAAVLTSRHGKEFLPASIRVRHHRILRKLEGILRNDVRLAERIARAEGASHLSKENTKEYQGADNA